MAIKIEGLSKDFGSYQALNNVNLEFAEGELTALLGPSGCGKTTLLRIIAGLEQPSQGSVIMDGVDTAKLPIQKRSVGFVFQHYALFRRMTVQENVAFGLKVLPRNQRPAKEKIQARVKELLGMVQMDWALDRYPHQLSGGQRQRVALARALAVNPKVLLLDEPFSALDAKVRLELRRWLRKLHDEIHLTSVFVTHDQEEALELADKVVIINKGRIEQQGAPSEVYDHPANPFVYQFLGNVNVFHGRLTPRESQAESEISFVRPHEIGIAKTPLNSEDWQAQIVDVRMVGAFVGVDLVSPAYSGIIEAQLSREEWKALGFQRGDQVYVQWKAIKVFYPGEYQI